MNRDGLEIERKYLIRCPDPAFLLSLPGAFAADITQVYLLSDSSERVRKRTTSGNTEYFHTVKHRVSDITCQETERVISDAEYTSLLKRADPSRRPIQKTRYVVPFAGQLLEIDIFPFWSDRALLEIELTSETQAVSLPDFLSVIREVTDDPRYKNAALAKSVPQED